MNSETEEPPCPIRRRRAHVALEVGDIEEALAFYGRLFEFKLRGKSEDFAFIDLGDQFLALQKGRKQPADDGRHFGLVVDDKEAVRKALRSAKNCSGTSASTKTLSFHVSLSVLPFAAAKKLM